MWAAAEAECSARVTIDLGAECKITEILLSDAPYGRTRDFDLEAKTADGWHRITAGTTIGPGLHIPAGSLRATAVRLNTRKASDMPTLAEFRIFAQGDD